MIDLRSDTLTKPTEAMRAAMASAEVGDDVYGEDPTVARLEERVAGLFGHEAALFVPTGSMGNVLAVRSLVAPGQEVLCEASAHIVRAELGAHGAYSGHHHAHLDPPARPGRPADDPAACSPRTWGRSSCRPPRSRSRTPTTSPAARCCRSHDLRDLREYATGVGARIHLDGARIWNAHVATGTPLAEYGAIADVLSVCLSKGLGAPVGSLLVGSRDTITEARVWRKRMGGGMRQVGILAAAGLHALDHHVERLADDHAHARLLAEACGVDPASVDTNIVVVDRAGRRRLRRGRPRRGRAGRDRRADRGPDGHPPRRRRATTPRRPPRCWLASSAAGPTVDAMEHMEDAVGSAKPPKPPGPPRDHERTKRLLLVVIAVAHGRGRGVLRRHRVGDPPAAGSGPAALLRQLHLRLRVGGAGVVRRARRFPEGDRRHPRLRPGGRLGQRPTNDRSLIAV